MKLRKNSISLEKKTEEQNRGNATEKAVEQKRFNEFELEVDENLMVLVNEKSNIHFYRTYKRSPAQYDVRRALSTIPSQCSWDRIFKNKSLLSCYDCGGPGDIKAKCRNTTVQGDGVQPATLDLMNFCSISMNIHASCIIEVSICGSRVTVCADPGVTFGCWRKKLVIFSKNGQLIIYI
ncbi:hypothetical protein CEXT_560331 [Caerostris extrusa]|uniref:Uncharacterized protein n=1 Tax=Caerostris extrusa TaxID=172846 RepID=A0AAV4MN73_CAEEX|nr:hypothetical protein CEXT_560331 [Caerostris extrusa]